ncbi:hypothetical protein FS749_005003, partial [Ceratobasidium sp. UAMH 11750]
MLRPPSTSAMSLGVNLASRDLLTAYQSVLNGDPNTDWCLFTYEKGSNDLKVQDTGSGGLAALEEEFSDGRMQYAFVRVIDPNTQLNKFVQINWCGDGVPESRKGLFHTHSSAVAAFLKGTHVVVNARNEADVSPALIMKKVNDASGAKYSFHKEAPKRVDPIAPVGSSYKPIGAPDVAAMRKGAKPDVIGKVGTAYTPAREELANIRATPQPSVPSAPRPVPTAPSVAPSWDAPAAPPVPPASSRPTGPPSIPSTARPVPSPAAAAPPPNPAEEDRIMPVGTAYTPVSLPKPKKLVNPFEARQAEQQAAAPPPGPRSGGGLTWSQRQALRKQQEEEENARSKAALAIGVGAVAVGAAAAIATSQVEQEPEPAPEPEPEEQESYDAPPPPPPPPPAPPRPVVAREPEPEPEAVEVEE